MNKKTWPIAGIILFVGVLIVWLFMVTNKPTVNHSTNLSVNKGPTETYTATLTMTEYAFTPSEIKAQSAQTIRVKLINHGKTAHSFTFKNLDFNSGSIAAGASKVIVFTTPSKAGSYEFHCGLPDHKDKPMTGTLVVQ